MRANLSVHGIQGVHLWKEAWIFKVLLLILVIFVLDLKRENYNTNLKMIQATPQSMHAGGNIRESHLSLSLFVHAGLGAVTWEAFLHFFSSERSLMTDSVLNPMCVQPMCTQPLCMQAAMCAPPMYPNAMCKLSQWWSHLEIKRYYYTHSQCEWLFGS